MFNFSELKTLLNNAKILNMIVYTAITEITFILIPFICS